MAKVDSDADTNRVPPPDAPRSIGHQQRVAIFGRFNWVLKPQPEMPEAIEIDRAWTKANLVQVKIPWAGVSTSGRSPDTRTITVHRLAAGPIVGLWESWRDAGLLPLVLGFSGAWVARLKRGKARSTNPADLSNHAWGTAFDINAPWNGLGKKPAAIGTKGCVIPLVPFAYEHGFAWGGDFSSPDGMHFELAQLDLIDSDA